MRSDLRRIDAHKAAVPRIVFALGRHAHGPLIVQLRLRAPLARQPRHQVLKHRLQLATVEIIGRTGRDTHAGLGRRYGCDECRNSRSRSNRCDPPTRDSWPLKNNGHGCVLLAVKGRSRIRNSNGGYDLGYFFGRTDGAPHTVFAPLEPTHPAASHVGDHAGLLRRRLADDIGEQRGAIL